MQVEINAQNDTPVTVEVIGGIIRLSVGDAVAELSERQSLDLIEAIHAEPS